MSAKFPTCMDESESPSHLENRIRRVARESPASLPACMRHEEAYCDACTFANPETCIISREPDFATAIKYRLEAEMALRKVIREVILQHGRPMYWDIIATMVQDRKPRVSRQLVYALLSTCRREFKSFGRGVYGVVDWHSGPTDGTG